MPPARWLGPTQQGMGLGSAPCHCVGRREAKAGYERPRGGRTEPAFKQSGASIPRLPRSPQNTGEFINALLERCQTRHPPSHQPSRSPIPRYAPCKVAWPHPTRGGPWALAADLATVSGRSERPGGGRVYIQIRTKVREVRTGKRAYKNLDTCRYEPGYVQIRSICPDTDKLEYTYWSTYINTYEYVGKNTYINTYE